MKIRNILAIAAALAFPSAVNAATITVSAGFGVQGLSVTLDGSAADSFLVSVGNWDGSSFTMFGDAVTDVDKVNAVITAGGPSSLNGLAVHLMVADTQNRSFVILSSNAGTSFPPDVAAAGGTTFNAALGSGLSLVATDSNSTFDSTGNAINLVAVPEPSVAILGALGALGLIRRRR